jgi:GNAT superfamily N-acetyltransferase
MNDSPFVYPEPVSLEEANRQLEQIRSGPQTGAFQYPEEDPLQIANEPEESLSKFDEKGLQILNQISTLTPRQIAEKFDYNEGALRQFYRQNPEVLERHGGTMSNIHAAFGLMRQEAFNRRTLPEKIGGVLSGIGEGALALARGAYYTREAMTPTREREGGRTTSEKLADIGLSLSPAGTPFKFLRRILAGEKVDGAKASELLDGAAMDTASILMMADNAFHVDPDETAAQVIAEKIGSATPAGFALKAFKGVPLYGLDAMKRAGDIPPQEWAKEFYRTVEWENELERTALGAGGMQRQLLGSDKTLTDEELAETVRQDTPLGQERRETIERVGDIGEFTGPFNWATSIVPAGRAVLASRAAAAKSAAKSAALKAGKPPPLPDLPKKGITLSTPLSSEGFRNGIRSMEKALGDKVTKFAEKIRTVTARGAKTTPMQVVAAEAAATAAGVPGAGVKSAFLSRMADRPVKAVADFGRQLSGTLPDGRMLRTAKGLLDNRVTQGAATGAAGALGLTGDPEALAFMLLQTQGAQSPEVLEQAIGAQIGFGGLTGATMNTTDAIVNAAANMRPISALREMAWGADPYADLGEVKSSGYGLNANLDTAHDLMTKSMGKAGSIVNHFREVFRKGFGGETIQIYALPQGAMGEAAVQDAMARGVTDQKTLDALRAAATEQGAYRGFFQEDYNINGKKQRVIMLNGDASALGHETTHFFMSVLPDAAKSEIYTAINKAYSTSELNEIRKSYEEKFAQTGLTKKLSMTETIEELAAETGAMILGGVGVTQLGVPPKVAATIYRNLLGGLEKIGMVDPATSQLGFDVHPQVMQVMSRVFRTSLGDMLTMAATDTPIDGRVPTPETPAPQAATQVTPQAPATQVTAQVPAPRPAQPATSAAANIRVSPEQQAAFAREQGPRISAADASGVDTARAYVAADPTLAPEQRVAVETLTNVLTGDPASRAVELEYESVKSRGDEAALARQATREEAYRQEKEGVLPKELRETAQKVIVPDRFEVITTNRGQELILHALSVDKVLQNVDLLVKDMVANKAEKLSPYEIVDGKLTPESAKQLYSDIQTYSNNHANGFRGDGNPITVPAGYEGRIPPQTPGFQPKKLSTERMQFINTLMGKDVAPPITARKDVARTTPANISAQQLARAGGAEVAPSRISDPRKSKFAGFDAIISETNALRDKLAEAGVNIRDLNAVNERIKVENIKGNARILNELDFGRVSTDLARAGFMPGPIEEGTARFLYAQSYTTKDGKEKTTKFYQTPPTEKSPAGLTITEDMLAERGLTPVGEPETVVPVQFAREGETVTPGKVKTAFGGELDASFIEGLRQADERKAKARKEQAAKEQQARADRANIPVEQRAGELLAQAGFVRESLRGTGAQFMPGEKGEAPAVFKGYQEGLPVELRPSLIKRWTGEGMSQADAEARADMLTSRMAIYDLTEDIPGHPAGSTLTGPSLERYGYSLPVEGPKFSPEARQARREADAYRRKLPSTVEIADSSPRNPVVIIRDNEGNEVRRVTGFRDIISPAQTGLPVETSSKLAAALMSEWRAQSAKYVAENGPKFQPRPAGDSPVEKALDAEGFSFSYEDNGNAIYQRVAKGDKEAGALVYAIDRNTDSAEIYSIFVFPEFRGKNISEALYRRMARDLQERKIGGAVGIIVNPAAARARSRVFDRTFVDLRDPDKPTVSMVDPKARYMPATPADFTKENIPNILNRSGWMIVTAENPDGVKAPDAQNKEANLKLWADAVGEGRDIMTGLKGKYGYAENPLVIFGATPQDAIAYARKYKQQSVLTPHGLVYQDGTLEPATGEVTMFDKAPDDYFSTLPDGTHFRAEIDFSKRIPMGEWLDQQSAEDLDATQQFGGENLPNAVGSDLNLIHLGSRPIDVVDPSFMGKGAATSLDMRGLPKSFFFEEGSPLGSDKGLLGRAVHEASIPGAKIYDTTKGDPLNWFGEPNREAADQSLVDAGYNGVRVVDGPRRVVATFKPVPVEYVGDSVNPDNAIAPSSPYSAPKYLPRTKPDPEKTVKAYKLFRVDERKPGKLFPLFVNANDPVPIGRWVDAEVGPITAGGKVASKLGPLAYRPGWHAGDVPVATHIGKGREATSRTRPENQVWAEVEMAADVDWQAEANARARRNKKGEIIRNTAAITDQVPVDGFYRFKTSPTMTGEWLIGGAMKVNRVLTDAEVKAVNDAAGLADLPRERPFDAAKYGFAPEAQFMPDTTPQEPVPPDPVMLSRMRPEVARRLREAYARQVDEYNAAKRVAAAPEPQFMPAPPAELFANKIGRDINTATTVIMDNPDSLGAEIREVNVGERYKMLAARAREIAAKGGVELSHKSRAEDVKRYVAEAIAEEILWSEANLKGTASGRGWYEAEVTRMVNAASQKWPELADRPDGTITPERALFTAIAAITSNGQEVQANMDRTVYLYDQYKKNGRLITDGRWGGTRKAAMNNGLKLVQLMMDQVGMDGMMKLLTMTGKVGEINKILKKAGKDHLGMDEEALEKFKITGENVGQTGYGSSILGPKIGGAFFQNLLGNLAPFTMDLWFSRTMNRHNGSYGTPNMELVEKNIARAKAADPTLKDKSQQEMIDWAIEQEKKIQSAFGLHSKRSKELVDSGQRPLPKKERTEKEKAVGRLVDAWFGEYDGPRNGGERAWFREIFGEVDKVLAERGADPISNADKQAILWYYEKLLNWRLGGDEAALGASYGDAIESSLARVETLGQAAPTIRKKPAKKAGQPVIRARE